jgi:magnesium chelatase accessory protein
VSARLDFATDGQNWPHRSASRFVEAAGLRWHVQDFGSQHSDHDSNQEPILLLHGTAAATHSWRGLAPLLARTHRVVAVDLPGHGFTERLPHAPNSLPNMARATAQVLAALNVAPGAAIGHSAGAAILIRMAADGALPAATTLIGLNAALMPYGGFPGRLLMPLARGLAGSPLLTRVFAWRAADLSSVERVLTSTGSKIEKDGLELYATLFRNAGHVAAAMDMMAHWDLDGMPRLIAELRHRLVLVACGGDQAVRAEDAFDIQKRAPAVHVEFVRGLGHLAHEEQPVTIAAVVEKHLNRAAVPSSA